MAELARPARLDTREHSIAALALQPD